MVNVYLVIDEILAPKVQHTDIEVNLNDFRKKVNYPDQPISLFIICTHSKRWREGKWKNKHGLNYAIRLPREAVDAMSREEVSAQAVEMAKKALGWDQKPAA